MGTATVRPDASVIIRPATVRPDISVVISTYARPAFLDCALASVHAQTYDRFEVIVVDDCTEDVAGMEAVLEPWTARFEERGIDLIAIRLPENSGYQCVPKNVGIIHSNGDFIAYLDDDNVWRPEHLAVLMEAIVRLDVDLVYGGRHYVNATERTDLITGDVEARPWDPDLLHQGNYIDTSDILHSKGAAYLLAGRDGTVWDQNLSRFADWNLLLRWATMGLSAAPVPAILSEYRWHGGNLQLTRPVIAGPMTFSLEEYERRVERVAQ